jgi:hypothetical protein
LPRGWSVPQADALDRYYADCKELHGLRPTAVEVYQDGYNPRAVRERAGSWARFVGTQGDLDESQRQALDAHGAFIDALDTTEMPRTRSMKRRPCPCRRPMRRWGSAPGSLHHADRVRVAEPKPHGSGERGRPAARGETPASHRDGRRASVARRDDREYREYLSEEQRSQRGCIARRMQLGFHHGLPRHPEPRGARHRRPPVRAVPEEARRRRGRAVRVLRERLARREADHCRVEGAGGRAGAAAW